MGVDDCIGLARALTANDVAYRKQVGAFLSSFFHGSQRIGGLTGLADPDHNSVRADNGIAITKLGRVVDFNRYSGQPFNQKLSNVSCVKGCSHSDEVQSIGIGENRWILNVRSQADGPIACDAAQQCVAYRAWLLVDFLEHEVRVSFFFSHGSRPGNPFRLTTHALTRSV